ncbi:MAG: polysaccharide lyase 6 family protein [Bacteroidia bacterium]|nr:polysaccharide lyase 6 family protein [Bacteroidia bacterium]
MKIHTVALLFLAYSCTLSAKNTLVSTASEINGGSWSAGDTIVMKNGSWVNQSISLKAVGTALNPIVLTAQTPGQVILGGTSKLAFSGSYLVVNGLYFKDGTLSGSDVIAFRTSSTEFANNCRVTNTAIVNCNPADATVDSKWVSLYGEDNQVDHCSFQNKTNSGTLLVVWLKSGIEPKHVISQNYFGYRNPNLDSSGSAINGQEIIRVGDSSTSMQTASVTVSGNYFEKCNGEGEIISNKSCENVYFNNLFLECEGMLTLRHGNRCRVEGNYFFGNGLSDTGGVRIIGEDHKVFNNYFEKLRGTSYRAALCVVRGKENSLLNEYFQVKNAVVAFNTMVDCSQAFNINYNSSSTCAMPPIGTIIAHNQVYNTAASNTNIIIAQSDVAMDVTWKNNLMNQGQYSNFTYTTNQVVTGQNPMMTLSGTSRNMYEPTMGSALSNFTTAEYPEVLFDIRGRSRVAASKLPGSSEIQGVVTRSMPVKTAVGASFFNNPPNGIHTPSQKTGFNAYLEKNALIANASIPGRFSIFDTSGKRLLQKDLTEGSYTTLMAHSGLFILRFETFKDGCFVQKMIVR